MRHGLPAQVRQCSECQRVQHACRPPEILCVCVVAAHLHVRRDSHGYVPTPKRRSSASSASSAAVTGSKAGTADLQPFDCLYLSSSYRPFPDAAVEERRLAVLRSYATAVDVQVVQPRMRSRVPLCCSPSTAEFRVATVLR